MPVDPGLRRSNVGRLLIEAFDRFEARIVDGVRRRGFADFKLSDTSVLRNVDLEGTRISEIARRARMTPQGAGQTVRDLERRGYVETVVDPADARAKLVRFTEAGRELIGAGQAVNRELDREWSELLGGDGLDALRDLLDRLVHGLGEDGKPGSEVSAGNRVDPQAGSLEDS